MSEQPTTETSLTQARSWVATHPILTVAGAVVVLLLVAMLAWNIQLSSASDRVDDSGPAATAAPVWTPPAPAAPAPTPIAQFGQAFNYADGLAVTVSAPQFYTPGKYAAKGASDTRFVTVEVGLVNGTEAPVDAQQTVLSAVINSTEAQQVFDTANKVSGAPNVTVLPGKGVKYRVAFGTSATGPLDLQIQVAPGFGIKYSTAIFTGVI